MEDTLDICSKGIVERFAFEMTKKDARIQALEKELLWGHVDSDGAICNREGRYPCRACDLLESVSKS